MIWEIDEIGDGVIDWDEFQLTYYRNIMDTSNGNEPCTFFHLLEVLIFLLDLYDTFSDSS